MTYKKCQLQSFRRKTICCLVSTNRWKFRICVWWRTCSKNRKNWCRPSKRQWSTSWCWLCQCMNRTWKSSNIKYFKVSKPWRNYFRSKSKKSKEVAGDPLFVTTGTETNVVNVRTIDTTSKKILDCEIDIAQPKLLQAIVTQNFIKN